jgi:hypothetical protein
MNQNQMGKGFAFLVVAGAIIAFILFYWFLRRADVQETGSPQDGAAHSLLSTSVSTESLSSDSPLRLETEAVTQQEPHSGKRADSPHNTNELMSDVVHPPASITFRASPAQERRADTPSSEGSDRLQNSSPKTSWSERTQAIDLHTDAQNCKVCTRSRSGWLPIPRGCTYSSHTITQLYREPFVPIAQVGDAQTSFQDSVDSDVNGRIERVTLSVRVNKSGSSPISPSITMRLTVVAVCPNAADANK